MTRERTEQKEPLVIDNQAYLDYIALTFDGAEVQYFSTASPTNINRSLMILSTLLKQMASDGSIPKKEMLEILEETKRYVAVDSSGKN